MYKVRGLLKATSTSHIQPSRLHDMRTCPKDLDKLGPLTVIVIRYPDFGNTGGVYVHHELPQVAGSMLENYLIN